MASPVPPASSWSPMPPSPVSPSCRSTLLTGLVGGFFVGVVATVALFICCGKKRGQPQSSGKRIFTLGELQRCTSDFSEAQRLGEGGSALVYKGALSSGEDVAVKRLKKEDGGKTVPGFETEVENLSRAHHKHVVSLVGYCIAKTERILVYEYVSNKTLEFHLHGHESGQPTLDWLTRLKIALGSAKGLAYLHEGCHPKIIHRDIKATNILLERDFEAKIADFGLAKCISERRSHVTTQPRGTYGYIDPKYWQSRRLTEKADIYSFGMVLLELITGRKPSDIIENHDGLFNWVRYKLEVCEKDPNFETLADDELRKQGLPEINRVGKLAMACVDEKAENRPTMSKIVRDLEDIVRDLEAVKDCPNRMPGKGPGGGASTAKGKARTAG